MTYELCVKLKNLGLYQRYDVSPYSLRRHYLADGVAMNLVDAQKIYSFGEGQDGGHPYLNDVLTYIPSLEELFAALGSKLERLQRLDDITYLAIPANESILNGIGKTPWIALANLFININEKTS